MVALTTPHAGLYDRDGALAMLLVFALAEDRPAWADLGPCQDRTDLEWVPTRGYDPRAAQAVCRDCPVRRECARFALADDTLEGVWAGTQKRARDLARRSGWTADQLLAEVDRRGSNEREDRLRPEGAFYSGGG